MRVAASSWEVFFFWKKLFEVLAPRFVELISQQKTTLIELREILVIGWNSVTLTSVLVISILIGYSRRVGYNIPDGNISYKYLFPPNFLLMKNCHFLDVSSDMRIWSHGRPPSWNVCWQLCELKIIYWQINSGPISVRCMIHVLLVICWARRQESESPAKYLPGGSQGITSYTSLSGSSTPHYGSQNKLLLITSRQTSIGSSFLKVGDIFFYFESPHSS